MGTCYSKTNKARSDKNYIQNSKINDPKERCNSVDLMNKRGNYKISSERINLLQQNIFSKIKKFFPKITSNGQIIWLSRDRITERDVKDVLDAYEGLKDTPLPQSDDNGTNKQKRCLHINTGTHGDLDGNIVIDNLQQANPDSISEDFLNIQHSVQFSLHIVSTFSPPIYPDNIDVIDAWCFSEVSYQKSGMKEVGKDATDSDVYGALQGIEKIGQLKKAIKQEPKIAKLYQQLIEQLLQVEEVKEANDYYQLYLKNCSESNYQVHKNYIQFLKTYLKEEKILILQSMINANNHEKSQIEYENDLKEIIKAVSPVKLIQYYDNKLNTEKQSYYYLYKGEVEYENQEKNAAFDSYNNYLKSQSKPQSYVYYKIIQIYFDKKQYKKALDQYNKVLENILPSKEKYLSLKEKILIAMGSNPQKNFNQQGNKIVSQKINVSSTNSTKQQQFKEKIEEQKSYQKDESYSISGDSNLNFQDNDLIKFFVNEKQYSISALTDLKQNDIRQLKIESIRNIDDNFLQKTIQLLSKYPTLKSLALSKLNSEQTALSPQIFKEFCKSLEKLSKATKISVDFQNNKISDELAGYLGNSLGNLKKLQSLNLQFAENSIEEKGSKILSNSLSRMSNLNSLKLDFNRSNIQTHFLFKAIFSLNKLTQLKLDFQNNQFQKEGALELGKGIKTLDNLTNFELFLGFNNLKDEACNDICAGIQQMTKLADLSLNLQGNQISKGGMEGIRNMLLQLKNIKNLKLDLGQNEIKIEGSRILSEGISKMEKLNKLTLDLFNTDLSVYRLCDSLSKLPNLSSLNLNFRSNFLTKGECKDLGYTLSQLINLRQLSLEIRYCYLKSEFINQIMDGISKLTDLNELTLDIRENELPLETTNSIKQGLQQLKNLKKVEILVQSNNIYAKQATKLENSLKEVVQNANARVYF